MNQTQSVIPPLLLTFNEGIKSLSVANGFTDVNYSVIKDRSVSDEKFLSVIMRTQGKRPIQMEQAITSLLAQDDHNFELIICIHDGTDDCIKNIIQLVDLYPKSIAHRISILSVIGGKRGVPMNVGIEHATGRYIAFLDDDDMVTGSWVSLFYDNSIKNPGTIVRNRCVDRIVEKRDDDSFTPMLTESNWIISRADDFNFLESLERNSSPIHSYAIPRHIITTFGTYVDPDLDVAEDWDYLMRNAILCGVSNNPETTAIYNRWSNSNSSSHLHGQDDWKESHKTVLERLTKQPVIISGDEAKTIHDLYVLMNQLSELVEYISDNKGFGMLLEKMTELERYKSYAEAGMQTSTISRSRDSLPKPMLILLVKIKAFIRTMKNKVRGQS